MKINLELDVEVHPLTDPNSVLAKLLYTVQNNLSVGNKGWFTYESDEAKGVPGILFRINSVKAKK